MKSIQTLIKNIKNQLPYFGLIAIYFLFVNIEVRKTNNNAHKKNHETLNSNSKNQEYQQLKFKIPVIPYKK